MVHSKIFLNSIFHINFNNSSNFVNQILVHFVYSMEFRLTISLIQKNYQFLLNRKILLAHSGGIDSCVLADLLLKSDCNFSVAHANFQLRSSESIKTQNFVSDWCQANQIPFYRTTFHVGPYQKHSKKGIQEATRDLRYQWFNYLLEINRFEYLLTAHHLNDQIETFFINAMRGSGIAGLRGIKETKKILRPLLTVSKRQIVDYAHQYQIDFEEDSSNADVSYQRNYIRHQIITPAEQYRSNFVQQFAKTLKNINLAHIFISKELNKIQKKVTTLKDNHFYYSITKLKQLEHLELCLFHWFQEYNFRVSEILKLMNAENGKYIQQNKFILLKSQDHLILTIKSVLQIDPSRYPLKLTDHKEGNMLYPIKLKWKILNEFPKSIIDSNFALLDEKKIKGDLTIGKINIGDWFYPNGLNGKVSISKFFRNLNYNKIDQQNQWILYVNNHIAWVIGRRCDRRFMASRSTPKIISFEYTR